MSEHFETDALIIGSGIAGLSCALKLAQEKVNVTIVTSAEKPERSNTYYAQGGIIFDNNSSAHDLIKDIFEASAKTSHLGAAEILAARGPKIVQKVLIDDVKTDFAKDQEGKLLFTQEAAHSYPRIIYKGDYTGKEIELSLLNYLGDRKRFPNISWLTAHTAIDLITPGHHGNNISQRYDGQIIVGAYLFDQKQNSVKKVMAKKTILATGGYGGLYLHSSNSEWSRGDGHAMARRAGATVVNMEFVQFHPTTFYSGTQHRHFLISEALRGEGGILKNSKNEAFMSRYHKDLELAPRDVVARAIWDEMIATKEDCVYLDMTHRDGDWLEERFPMIYEHCFNHGIDISKQPIPVVPAAHYTCGGVLTDLQGRTNLKNLFAVGEVACTGLHGANRLASTSLLEGLTFGHIAAEKIIKDLPLSSFYDSSLIKNWENGEKEFDLGLIHQDILTIKQTMWNYLGLKRSKSRLARASAMFRELTEEISRFYKDARLHDELIGLRNAVEVAFLVLNASSKNKESIGCFYRDDE